MNALISHVCALALLASVIVRHAEAQAPTTNQTPVRIGIYDSRAVAVAFTGSEAFKQWMNGLKMEQDKAKAEGNQPRLVELEAQAKTRQKLRHQQAFSTAPVDDILEHLKGQMPAIAKAAGVSSIVSKWDPAALAKYKKAEMVDVTMALVNAFKPNERQLKSAVAIQQHPPIPLEQAEQISD